MDVGDKRIGMAISDVLGWTAQGLDTLNRTNQKKDLEEMGGILKMYNPEKIIVGLPKNMNGSLGPQGEKTQRFGKLLKKEIYEGEIVFWDERLTSVQANRAMIDANVSRKNRKQNVDMIAAVFILQSYLDYINNQKKV